MKNIIYLLIITAMYCTIIYFVSCKQSTSNIISKIVVHKDSCWYKVNQYWERNNTLCCSVYVLEPCGLYNDGDTLGKPSAHIIDKEAINDSTLREYYSDGSMLDIIFFIDSNYIIEKNYSRDSVLNMPDDTLTPCCATFLNYGEVHIAKRNHKK